MSVSLLIDFGSTYTKGVMIDLAGEEVLAQTRVPSTVESDVREGLQALMSELKRQTSEATVEKAAKMACSSAAGGLRMGIIGLVPELTVEAGRRAAYNAGAKVIGALAGIMSESELDRLEAYKPDIILLSGGTDGGNKEVIISNARLLAARKINAPVILAGNKNAVEECRTTLQKAGLEAYLTENVMPEVNLLNIEPVRETIRQVFIDRIVRAKGIDKVQSQVELLMPTPNAVLKAATILAAGTQNEEGLGELLVVDVGGATTDIYSAGLGAPTSPNIILRGLPEPYVKRTVEGDLGVRHNAMSIIDLVGFEQFIKDTGLPPQKVEWVLQYCRNILPPYLPHHPDEADVDKALAKTAVRLGVERHAGTLELTYIPGVGEAFIQKGKDLRNLELIIGTGGPVVFSKKPIEILAESLYNHDNRSVLKPLNSRFFLDQYYMLYALGLLSINYPRKVLRIAKKYLHPIN